MYSLAILLSVPLQLFPAVRITENGLFTRSGKASIRVKWYKNLFRFSMVMTCTLISLVGAADLDKFVSFIGSFAWYVLFLYTCRTFIPYPLQCTTMLCISGHVALQGLCAYPEAEDGRHCYDLLWSSCCYIHHDPNRSSSCLPFFVASPFWLTYFVVDG